MKNKVCTKCKIKKSFDEFYLDKQMKDGKSSWCKECYVIKAINYNLKHQKKIKIYRKKWYEKHNEESKDYNKKYKHNYYLQNKEKLIIKQKEYCKKYPWKIVFNSIKQRCNNPKNKDYKNYGGRGIKCLITVKEIKKLWFRDKAYNLNQPTIDRKNNDKNYTIKNCQFIEMLDNIAKQDKKAVIQKLSKPITQYDFEGNFIRSWKSITKAERSLKCTHVSGVCNGNRKTAGGFIWKFKTN